MLRAWKSPLREAIASNRKQQGYILVEILAAVAIFLFAVGTLFIQANKWQEYCYKNQVRLVAHILAADLREIQERALFKGSQKVWDLATSDGNRSAYWIYNGYQFNEEIKRVVRFKNFGCGDVYFSEDIYALTYYPNGTPTKTGAYVLCHRKLPGYACYLNVQPVTGRISINETK